MFDSIFLKIKCPYCGVVSEMECQTKELECTLQRWHKGDNVGDSEIKELECCADCKSPECMDHELRQDGYRSGFGRIFDVSIEITLGMITGKYQITSAGAAYQDPFDDHTQPMTQDENWG